MTSFLLKKQTKGIARQIIGCTSCEQHADLAIMYRKSGLPKKSPLYPSKKDPVFLIYQYFVNHNSDKAKQVQRQRELITCLQRNCQNKYIHKIYLLNERIYTMEELGLPQNMAHKIEQINIGRRLMFSDIFMFVRERKLNGYILFGNADIFYDYTLQNIFTSELFYKKTVFCQTRLDWDPKKRINRLPNIHPEDLKNGSSQDSWLLHSRWAPPPSSFMNFHFGRGGCDNCFCFILALLGFNLYNEPFTIQTNHLHQSASREWTKQARMNTNVHILMIPPFLP